MRRNLSYVFQKIKQSTGATVSAIIILSHVSRLCLKLIKCRNDNATEKFYWLEVFGNVEFLMKISKILKILKKKRKN